MRRKKTRQDLKKLKVSECVYKVNRPSRVDASGNPIFSDIYFRIREDGAILAGTQKDIKSIEDNRLVFKFSDRHMNGLGADGHVLEKKRNSHGLEINICLIKNRSSREFCEPLSLLNGLDTKLIRAARINTMKKNGWKSI